MKSSSREWTRRISMSHIKFLSAHGFFNEIGKRLVGFSTESSGIYLSLSILCVGRLTIVLLRGSSSPHACLYLTTSKQVVIRRKLLVLDTQDSKKMAPLEVLSYLFMTSFPIMAYFGRTQVTMRLLGVSCEISMSRPYLK